MPTTPTSCADSTPPGRSLPGRPPPSSAPPRRAPPGRGSPGTSLPGGHRRHGRAVEPSAPAGRRTRSAGTGLGLEDPRRRAGRARLRRAWSTRPPPPSCAGCSRSSRAAARPAAGTPVGRHQLWGEVVCLDPLAWLRAGLVTNPGVFVLGQPGTGKSALVKRLVTGAVAFGTKVLILGDTKPDYTPLVRHLGGQVIRIGRGLDRINPLDAGPLGAALRQMTGPDAQQLRWEVRSRRLALLMALATLIRGERISNAEEVVLGRAIDLLDERNHGQAEPTVADVLRRDRGRPGHAALGRPRRHPAPVPGPGRRPGVHPGPAVHRVAGRGVRRAHLPADRPGRPRGQRGHLRRAGGRGQAAHRRDAVHLELRVRLRRRRQPRSPASAPRRGAPTSGSWTNCGAPCAARPAWSSTPTRSPG